jgi:hypothetical protein
MRASMPSRIIHTERRWLLHYCSYLLVPRGTYYAVNYQHEIHKQKMVDWFDDARQHWMDAGPLERAYHTYIAFIFN